MKQLKITFLDPEQFTVFIRVLEKMKNQEPLSSLDLGFLQKSSENIKEIIEMD